MITDLVPPSATLPSSPNPHAEFYWGYGQVYGFSGVILFFFAVFLVQFLAFLTRLFYDNGLWLRRERSGRWNQIRYHHHHTHSRTRTPIQNPVRYSYSYLKKIKIGMFMSHL